MPRDTVARRILIDGSLVWAMIAGLQLLAHADATARWLDLAARPWRDRLFDAGLCLALVAAGALAFRWIQLLGRIAARIKETRPAESLWRSGNGTLMVEFALVLPLIGFMFLTIIQLALLANAALVVRHAAFVAARTTVVGSERPWLNPNPPWKGGGFLRERYRQPKPGMVLDPHPFIPSLPLTEVLMNQADCELAAHLVLATISPTNPSAASDPDARALIRLHQAQASRHGQSWGASDLDRRMAYARNHTSFNITKLLVLDAAGNPPAFSPVNWLHNWLNPHLQKFIRKMCAKVHKGCMKACCRAAAQIPYVPCKLVCYLPCLGIQKACIKAWQQVVKRMWQWLASVIPSIHGPHGHEVEVTYSYKLPLPGFQLIPGIARNGRVDITASAWLQGTGPRELFMWSLFSGATPEPYEP